MIRDSLNKKDAVSRTGRVTTPARILTLAGPIALAALVSAACEPERSEGVFDAQLIEFSTEELSGEIADGAGRGTGSMDGSWVKVHENSACLGLGRGNEVLSYTTYLLHMRQEGNAVYEERILCAVEPGPVLDLRPIITPEVLEAVEVVSFDTGLVSSAGLGGSYSSPTELVLWGITLSDPLLEPIPRTDDDPRVIDQDGDGNPGVTFRIEASECERYVSQRTITSYQGLFTTPNRVEGTTTTVAETRTLGSTGICGVNVAVLPNDQYSRFVMLRADGDNTTLDLRNEDGEVTCETVNAVRTQILPRRDPNRTHCP